MSYGLEVLNRIDVANDPVNWVDPWGLKGYGPFGSIASYSPTIASNFQAAEAGVESAINTVSDTMISGPNITSGEVQAAGYLIGGAGVTALVIMTSPEGAPLIGAGIPLLAEGIVRAGAESLGGDTANLPNWWGVLAEILEGLTKSNEGCVE